MSNTKGYTVATLGELTYNPGAPSMTPVKRDLGKARYDLLPPLALDEVVRCMTYGAAVYADWNYLCRPGLRQGRLVAAALRHLWAHVRGEDEDSESGLSHLAHAACCVLMLREGMLRGVWIDDRPPRMPQDRRSTPRP